MIRLMSTLHVFVFRFSKGKLGGRFLRSASKGGLSMHLRRYKNLERSNLEVELKGEQKKMTARCASDAEKRTLWPKLVAMYRDFDDYQARTLREILVVILSPR